LTQSYFHFYHKKNSGLLRITAMKFIVLCGALVTTFMFGWLFGQSSSDASSLVTPANAGKAQASNSAEDKAASLHCKQVGEPTTFPAPKAVEPLTTTDTTTAVGDTSLDTPASNVLPALDAEEFAHKFSTDNKAVFQQLSDRFNQETVDTAWARQEQQRIDQWIKSASELRPFSASNVECRSTICSLSFAIRSIEANDELTQIISSASQQSATPINGAVVYDRSESGVLRLYIARNQFTKLL
jgi:hypothetical protein